MKKANLWLFVSLFSAAFLLAACGDDDKDATTPTNTGSGSQGGDSFSLTGTWKISGQGKTAWSDFQSYEGELTFGADGKFADYFTETYGDENSERKTSHWTKFEGTWAGQGQPTITLTKVSNYDGGSGATSEEEISDSYVFGYTRVGNAILASSHNIGGFNLFTRDGEALKLDQSKHELVGEWKYEEQWPQEESKHMYNQYFATFKADGSYEYGMRAWNSIDKWYNQGYMRTGHFVDLTNDVLKGRFKDLSIPEGTKGIVLADQYDYYWDFNTQSWILSALRQGGEPSEYVISNGKLYLGHAGTDATALQKSYPYERK